MSFLDFGMLSKKGDKQKLLSSSSSDSSSDSLLGLQDALPSALPKETLNEVASVQKGGRAAKQNATELGQTRTQEVVSSAKGAVTEAALVTADTFVPGLGSAIGGAKAAVEARGQVKQGDNKGAVATVVKTGAAFIPVVGPFLAMAEQFAKGVKATCQSDKSRTAEKLVKAQGMRSQAAAGLEKIAALRTQVDAVDPGKDKTTCLDILEKAERRWNDALIDVAAWVDKKESHGTMPLLAGAAESSESEAEADPFLEIANRDQKKK